MSPSWLLSLEWAKRRAKMRLRMLAVSVVIVFLAIVPTQVKAQCYTEVCFFKGLDYAMKGMLKEAEDQFRRTLEYDQNFKAATEALRIMEDYHSGRVKEEALRSIFKGVYYMNKKRFERAAEEFTKAIYQAPDYYYSYYLRAVLYSFRNETEKAIEDLTKSISLKPDFAEAYYNRAVLRHQMGQDALAIDDYTRAIELKADLYQAYYNRGLLLMEAGQLDSAVKDFSEALRYNPRHTKALLKQATAYQSMGRITEACKNYQKACKLGVCSAYEAAVTRGICK